MATEVPGQAGGRGPQEAGASSTAPGPMALGVPSPPTEPLGPGALVDLLWGSIISRAALQGMVAGRDKVGEEAEQEGEEVRSRGFLGRMRDLLARKPAAVQQRRPILEVRPTRTI